MVSFDQRKWNVNEYSHARNCLWLSDVIFIQTYFTSKWVFWYHTAKTKEYWCPRSSLALWKLISSVFPFTSFPGQILKSSGWKWTDLNPRQGGSPRNKSNVGTLKDEKFWGTLWSSHSETLIVWTDILCYVYTKYIYSRFYQQFGDALWDTNQLFLSINLI